MLGRYLLKIQGNKEERLKQNWTSKLDERDVSDRQATSIQRLLPDDDYKRQQADALRTLLARCFQFVAGASFVPRCACIHQ